MEEEVGSTKAWKLGLGQWRKVSAEEEEVKEAWKMVLEEPGSTEALLASSWTQVKKLDRNLACKLQWTSSRV